MGFFVCGKTKRLLSPCATVFAGRTSAVPAAVFATSGVLVNANALPIGGAALEDGDGLAMVEDKDELAIAFEYMVIMDDDEPCMPPPPQADSPSAAALTAMDTHQPTVFMLHLPMAFSRSLARFVSASR